MVALTDVATAFGLHPKKLADTAQRNAMYKHLFDVIDLPFQSRLNVCGGAAVSIRSSGARLAKLFIPLPKIASLLP